MPASPINPARFLELIDKHFSPRARRVWLGEGRAHVELRTGDSQELHEVGSQLQREVERLPELYWAEVHQGTGRAVMAFQTGTLDHDAVVALVGEAELRAQMSRAVFDYGDHPADTEPSERVLLELVAESIGLLVGTSLRFSFFPRSRLAGTVGSALAIMRAVPRLQKPLVDRYGKERADLGLAVAVSLLHGPAQRPLDSLVGVVEKANLAGELAAQRKLWNRRQGRLVPGPGAPDPRPVPDRPVPLPRGPIEEYSDRAWAVALGGFGISFLSTRSVQRAFGALFGGIPRPARLGREVFSASLSRLLATRQILVLKRDALRRLDRIDCLVLQGNLVTGGAASIGRVVEREGEELATLRGIAERLFTVDAPLTAAEGEGYRLLPLGRSRLDLPEHLAERAKRLSAGGELVLSLERDEKVAALVEVRVRSRVGLEELVKAAHDASIRVVVASEDPEVLQTIPADDTLPGGEALWRGVRELQRQGRVVCVVAQGDSRALDVADFGIELTAEGAPVAWSADLVCRDDLTDVRLLIEATQVARDVSRQSVNVALAAASMGALASVVGILPMTTRRVLAIVNLASLTSMANGARLSAEFAKKPQLPGRDPTPWHALECEGVLTRLDTGYDGLSRQQIAVRARDISSHKSALGELSAAIGDEIFNPLVPLLAAGAGLSAVAGSVADAMMVGGVVGLNAVVGGAQRFRTERAIDKLARATRTPVLVRREGRSEEIPSDGLVKGDILLLGAGDVVPADCRLVEAHGLEVDASGLTGESLPVRKAARPSFEESIADRSSMLYAGSAVSSGHATAVVVATGAETEARRGAASFRMSARDSGVERRMRELMDLTAPVALAAGAGVIAVGLFRGRKLEQLMGSAVSLAVASVPEGLPLLATAAQLAAARRLRDRGALVRNARSLEVLGRVDTVCVDKTGTMTEGSVDLGLVSDGIAEEAPGELSNARARILASALRASPARQGAPSRPDPIDAALFGGGDAAHVTARDFVDDWTRIAEIPFDADRSYYAVRAETASGGLLSVKGAPEVLIDRCTFQVLDGSRRELSGDERAQLQQSAEHLAERGLRVLAVAERPYDEELDVDGVVELGFLGFVAFRDPVRPTARQALADLRRTGLRPVMITGDHPSTARAIAVEVGISAVPSCMTGGQLMTLDEDELTDRAREIDVFSRVTPSQKVRIVRALSRAGRTVAMVGDGANDAPAIRLASVGIALGEHSSEAARNAADIVLTDTRIETLVSAIVEGRAVWESVRDAVSILVGGNLGEIGFTLAGGLVSGRPPLSPRQLLLVNLFTDVAPATALALRKPTAAQIEELAEAGPDASMGWRLNRDIGARALVTTAGAGLAWSVSSMIGGHRGASTTALLALVGTQLGQTLSSGQRSPQVVATSVLSTLGLASVIQTPGVSGAFGCRPLGPIGWTIALGSSAAATAAGRYAPQLVEGFVKRRTPTVPELGLEGLSELTERAAQEVGAALADVGPDL